MFTVDRELSSSMLNKIYQDRDGIIWIATEDGLNRYDGAKFTVYRNEKDNPNSLLSDYVRTLFEDSQGRLFIGSLNGLQIYDRATDSFTTIPMYLSSGAPIAPNVGVILEQNNGEILIGTSGHSIFLLKTQGDSIKAQQIDQFIASNLITYSYRDKKGNLWIATGDNGIFRLDNNNQFKHYSGEKVAKLVKRIHYVSFVGMFRSDLFEGLCVGHAPKKCKICGKWFLTTNARHTKYCGGYAPGDKLHRTCRQIGNLKGREQRELADDHPVIQIYEKRLNTINRYIKRGKLDEDLAEVMKKLAKDKMLRAKSNVAYAKGTYEKEMEQVALKKEAQKCI